MSGCPFACLLVAFLEALLRRIWFALLRSDTRGFAAKGELRILGGTDQFLNRVLLDLEGEFVVTTLPTGNSIMPPHRLPMLRATDRQYFTSRKNE